MSYTRTYREDIWQPKYLRRHTSGWTAPITVLNSGTKLTWSGQRSGEKVENWREKIRDGRNASSPYTLDRTKLESSVEGAFSVLALDQQFTGGPISWMSEDGSGFHRPEYTELVHLVTNSSLAEATALTQVYKKIESELSHLNGSAVIAEGLDVIRQFGAPFEAIVDLTNRRLNRLYLESRGLKGSVSFRKIKFAQIVASTWLEYAFGLAPLISDTRKAAEALARWQYEATGEARMRSKAVGRGVAEAVRNTVTNTPAFSTAYAAVMTTTEKTTTERRVQYTVGLKATPSAAFGSNERLKQLLGFTPEKWIPAIWEVVPWSWLIDYFTNVSDILDAAVTSTANVTWVSKAVTTRSRREITATLNEAESRKRAKNTYGYIVGWSGTGSGGRTVRVRTTLTRTVPLGLGLPPLVLEHPFENAKKLANMAAVLLSSRKSNSALWLY